MKWLLIVFVAGCGAGSSESADAGTPGWWKLCNKWKYERIELPDGSKDWISYCIEWKI